MRLDTAKVAKNPGLDKLCTVGKNLLLLFGYRNTAIKRLLMMYLYPKVGALLNPHQIIFFLQHRDPREGNIHDFVGDFGTLTLNRMSLSNPSPQGLRTYMEKEVKMF